METKKLIFNKYKFPLRLSKFSNLEDLRNCEDENHIIDANGVEVLGTSEWLRIDDEDAQDIIDILNETYLKTQS